jgi:uncharacterized protein HemX
MAERAPAVVRSLFGAYGLALAAALLMAIGWLGGKMISGWEQQDRTAQAEIVALRRELVDTKYRMVVLEVHLATTREALTQRELHDRDQWRSIEALERQGRGREGR